MDDVRKKAADSVLKKGAKSYMHRIEQIAKQENVQLTKIKSKQEFWNFLTALPDHSVSRLWYSGHAGSTGLTLEITHNARTGDIIINNATIILPSEIIKNQKLIAKKTVKKPPKGLRFYGCSTSGFAETWTKYSKLPSEGAVNKINFYVIQAGLPSTKQALCKGDDILCRLEHSSTNEKKPTTWKEFDPPKPKAKSSAGP